MPEALTESEHVFRLFCRQRDIACARVETSRILGERRPDFRVRRPHQRSVIVEVKQVEPNAAERAAIVAGNAVRRWIMPNVVPGDRIRKAIGNAVPQLRTLTRGRYPSILMMYDTFPGRSNHTDPHSVLTAMRGVDVIDVEVPADPRDRPRFGPIRPGPGQKLRADANTTISAIGLMLRQSQRRITVAVFHNRHAKVPLRVADLRGSNVLHFDLAPDLSCWVRRAAI